MTIHFKNKLGFPVSLILFLLLVCPVIRADTGVNEVLHKVVENNKQFSKGMTVPYEREILTKSMAMLDDMGFDKATGVFFFKGPDLLKVRQETPTVETLTSNGKNIWWYVPDKKTVYRFDDMGRELSILCMIFMGLKDPGDTFSITGTETGTKGEYRLTLIPNEAWEEIDSIKVTVSDKDYRITRIEIYDIAGNITRFKLGEFEEKKDLDDGFFDFKIPAGVKVINETE